MERLEEVRRGGGEKGKVEMSKDKEKVKRGAKRQEEEGNYLLKWIKCIFFFLSLEMCIIIEATKPAVRMYETWISTEINMYVC